VAVAPVVALVSAIVPLGAAPSTHSMPCCKARTHCQAPAFGSACCAPEQAPPSVRERLKLPHDPPYLKNASFRI
jgi:hypothetical protein